MASIDDIAGWGTRAKRVSVIFEAQRPPDIGQEIQLHNIVEVVNQTATVERLIDVLAWVQMPESMLTAFSEVAVCHPCTSSGSGQDCWENDLVLRNSDGREARFEISDVASDSDGNRKHQKDLSSLRVVEKDGTVVESSTDARLFVAVSEEFAGYVRKRAAAWKVGGRVFYSEVKNTGKTRIFEIVRSSLHSR